MISSARYPLIRSAPAFQVVTIPFRVEHEDRVVLDALDEAAEGVLAFARPRFLRRALADLAEDDHGPADALVVAADRRHAFLDRQLGAVAPDQDRPGRRAEGEPVRDRAEGRVFDRGAALLLEGAEHLS